MNVFDIPIDEASGRPDAARFNCYVSPLPLSNLLTEVFAKSNSVSSNIFFVDSQPAVVGDWIERRIKPGKLWRIKGHLCGMVRSTFNQAYVPPKADLVVLLKSSPLPDQLRFPELACRNTDGMRVVEFKKLKRDRPLLDHDQVLTSGVVVRCRDAFYLIRHVLACRLDADRDCTFVLLVCVGLSRVAPFGVYCHIGKFFFKLETSIVLLDAAAVSSDEFIRLPGCLTGCSQRADGKDFEHVCSDTKLVVGRKSR